MRGYIAGVEKPAPPLWRATNPYIAPSRNAHLLLAEGVKASAGISVARQGVVTCLSSVRQEHQSWNWGFPGSIPGGKSPTPDIYAPYFSNEWKA